MMYRCLDLCDGDLRKNWRNFPHQFLILLEDRMQLLTSMEKSRFEEGGIVRSRGHLVPDYEVSPEEMLSRQPYVARVGFFVAVCCCDMLLAHIFFTVRSKCRCFTTTLSSSRPRTHRHSPVTAWR